MSWKLDVALMAPGMAFQGNTLETKSLGGSETAALCMARELAKLGHRVKVFSKCEPGEYDKVNYLPIETWGQYVQGVPHDVTIVQRVPEALNSRLNSRLILLWCHDLALGRQAPQFRGVMWNVDKVLVLSRFMADQYKQVYGLTDEELWVTRNGINLDRMAMVSVTEPRDRKKLIYAARPERGLDMLLGHIFPALLRRDAQLRLYLCGYDHVTEAMKPFYAQIDAMIRGYGDRVVWLGHLTKDQLAAHYATAGCYVYPTPSPTMDMFAEVSCISAMEAQACGLPVVSSRRGALPETLADGAGTLIDGQPTSPEYQAAFVDAVMRYVTDDAVFQAASEAGMARAATLDWGDVAAQWDAEFPKLIAERNDSPHRLALHFIRRSDIVAAKEAVRDLNDDLARDVKTTLAGQWGFTDAPDGYKAQYEKIGQTHNPDFDGETGTMRFNIVADWFGRYPDLQRVLDYGCAHGAFTVGLSNRYRDKHFLGVDIDQHGIAWANRFRAERAFASGQLAFQVGDDAVDLAKHGQFDCLFLGETLEHLPDPWRTVDALERWIKPGGRVLITTPYGPWEWLTAGYGGRPDPNPYNLRAHIWEFDFHDLRDMFGAKQEFQVHTQPLAIDERSGEAIGWHFISYIVDGTPTGAIDMARKRALQRPRESTSACIIAGAGAEDTMRWTLESLKDIVDEYVIGDTGMTAEGLRIAKHYRARVVPARSPLEHGFEAPRNDALAACRMDWVLWIDTDEKIVEPATIHKYLRRNLFNGYSIRQHHFSCDTNFKPDLPVRLFRRRPYQSKTMRFFGMIHEHPELGLNEGPGPTIILADAHIAHMGYLIESGRRKRFARNFPLLQRDIQTYPERILQKHFICRDQLLLANYELQRNGGMVTDAVRKRCEEVITMWRKHFRGTPGYMNADTLGYYSDANRILQQGFEFRFDLAAAKDATNLNGTGPVTYRFADMEDLQAELNWRARIAAEPYTSTWW